MDLTLRLQGLDRFLTAIHGDDTTLASLIDGLGFEPHQAALLQGDCLPELADRFIDAIRQKLTYGEKDLWFRLLVRRYGLDGEPPASLEAAAQALGIDYQTAAQAETDALQKCRYKATLNDLNKDLRRIALDLLSSSGARPQKSHIASKLNRLADLQAAVDLARMDYEAKRDKILEAVRLQLDALEAEYEPLLEAARNNAAALEAEIKNDVLLSGESVVTDVYQAIYMKGRVTWDTDAIDKYAVSHPEVLRFRRQGDPNVTLRKGR